MAAELTLLRGDKGPNICLAGVAFVCEERSQLGVISALQMDSTSVIREKGLRCGGPLGRCRLSPEGRCCIVLLGLLLVSCTEPGRVVTGIRRGKSHLRTGSCCPRPPIAAQVSISGPILFSSPRYPAGDLVWSLLLGRWYIQRLTPGFST